MPIIAIEARHDGTGKTTTAEAVAGWFGGSFVKPLTGEPWEVQRQRVNEGHDPDERFRYFRDYNCEQLNLGRIAAADGRMVTVDSSIVRTKITHTILGSEEARRYVPELGMMPDLTILLDLDEPARLARMQARDGGLRHPSYWDAKLFEQREAVAEAYDAYDGLFRVDASVPVPLVVRQVVNVAGLALMTCRGNWYNL
jgi:thymidylate kinase